MTSITTPTPDSAPDSAIAVRVRVRAFLAGTGGQFVRYAVTGLGLTILSNAIYWLLATRIGWPVQLANLAGYAVAVSLGYVVHGRWSFRGHGRRDDRRRTTVRFFLASLVSLGLNGAWIWLLTGWLHGPAWWPIVPMMAATPVAMFWLNRLWVFE